MGNTILLMERLDVTALSRSPFRPSISPLQFHSRCILAQIFSKSRIIPESLSLASQGIYTLGRLIAIQMSPQRYCVLDGTGGSSIDALIHGYRRLELTPSRSIQQ